MNLEALSEAQLPYVQALWDLGEATAGEVQVHLAAGGRKLAPTTVATVLRRLEAKGWVAHREEGRGFVYRALVSRERATGHEIDRLTGSFFGGHMPALVSHLLDARGVTRSELDEIKRLIEAKDRGAVEDDPSVARGTRERRPK